MRKTLKPKVEIDGRRLLILSLYEMPRLRQPLFLQPLPRRHREGLLKIPLEPRKTPARELRKFFHRDIEMKIAEHKFLQIDLMRFRKIEKEFPERGLNMQQQLHRFLHFQDTQRRRYLFFRITDIGYDRLEKPM